MGEIASAFIAGVGFLWDKIYFCYSFRQSNRQKRDDLSVKAETLHSMISDVVRKREEAIRRDEIVYSQVNDWLTRSKNLVNKHSKLKDPSPSGCFDNCCWRCDAITQVETLDTSFNAIIAEGDFERVSDPRPPLPFVLRPLSWIPNVNHVEMTSSVKKAVEMVMEALKKSDVRVIGVYGIPGVGKTTMMRKVSARVRDERLFNSVVFSTVSGSPNFEKVQCEVAWCLGIPLRADQSMESRASAIEDKINREGKILFILDDMWKEEELARVGIPDMVSLEECDSKIVFTTRIAHVCSVMRCQATIELETWSQQESREFLKRASGTNFDSRDFSEIAEYVADECKGLPIALVAVAMALGDKPMREWNAALDRLRVSKPPNLDYRDVVLRCVKLSYDYLGNKEKACFLMCCLFPEDYDIGKEELTRYMVGVGLFRLSSTIEEARRDTGTIMEKLTASGVLLRSDHDEERVKMHDVIRDVAIQMTSDEHGESSSEAQRHNFIVQTRNLDLQLWPAKESYEIYTAISLMCNRKMRLCGKPDCPRLQTLLLQDNHDAEIDDAFFKNFHSLQVLDLSGNWDFPSSIGLLKMLVMLQLDRCMLKDVSLLGALEKLAILSLRESTIFELPRDLRRLINLRMLDLTATPDLNQIPPKLLSCLKRLEELYMNASFAEWHNGVDEETSHKASFSELIDLYRLSILNVDIDHANCLPQNVEVVPNWRKFNICLSRDRDTRLMAAHSKQAGAYSRSLLLDTSTKILPSWFNEIVLKKTEALKYSGCVGLNIIEDHKSGFSSKLKYLTVEQCADVFSLMHLIDGEPVLQSLEELRIRQMDAMEEICNEELPIGSMENLKLLEVQHCNELSKSLLATNLIYRLSNLERLRVSESSLTGVFGVKYTKEKEAKCLGRLNQICLESLCNLQTIWDGPTGFADITKLKLVSVVKCDKLMNIFSVSMSKNLCELEELWVEECSTMEEIFGNESGVSQEKAKLLKLKTLCVKKLPSLRSICAANVSLECPSLEYLHVSDCPNFKTRASDFKSSYQVKENDEQQMNILWKRVREGGNY